MADASEIAKLRAQEMLGLIDQSGAFGGGPSTDIERVLAEEALLGLSLDEPKLGSSANDKQLALNALAGRMPQSEPMNPVLTPELAGKIAVSEPLPELPMQPELSGPMDPAEQYPMTYSGAAEGLSLTESQMEERAAARRREVTQARDAGVEAAKAQALSDKGLAVAESDRLTAQ